MKYKNIWKEAANNFIWDVQYQELFLASSDIKYSKWFVGGALNYTKTIFERNIDSGNGDKEAVVFYTSSSQRESYTYRTLLEGVNSYADYLERKGIDKKNRVLILTDSKKEQVFLILALLRLGVQFGVLYHRFPHTIINTLIKESKATHVVSTKKLAKMISVENVDIISSTYISKKRNVIIHPRSVSSEFNSFLCFSSGTTGKKQKIFLKGTAGSLIGLDYTARSYFFSHLEHSFLNTLEFAFAEVLVAGLITPLNCGKKVIVFDFQYRLNDASVIELLRNEKVESILSAPPFFEIIQNNNRANGVKNVILAGQKPSSAVLELIKKTFPKAQLLNAVGSTELGFFMMNLSDEKSGKITNIFKLPTGLEYKIIKNELHVKDTWPGLALPLNEKQAYRNRLHDNLFATGDMVQKIKDGFEILGRKDKIVKFHGRKMNLEYMENLLNTSPFISQSRCMIVSKNQKSEIAVFIILKQDYKKQSYVTFENLIKKTIAVEFGNYANMGKVIFVEEFPLSASGKVMERLLLKKYDSKSRS